MAIEVILPPIHIEIVQDQTRYKVINAGRGFAKTGILLAEVMEDLGHTYYTPYGDVLPNRIMYVAPTLKEAHDICWKRAKTQLEPITVGKPNESRHEITLINGAVFLLRGARDPDTLRGDYLTKVLLDEFAFFHPQGMTVDEMWQKVFRPMLSKVKPSGRAVFTSTPDGENEFYDMSQKGLDPYQPEWITYTYTSIQGGFMSEEEVMAARHDMTEEAWLQEYFALFVATAGRVYYSFDKEKNSAPCRYVAGHDIHWFFDFNEVPCVHSGLAHVGKTKNGEEKVWVFDEIALGNTPQVAAEFVLRYPPDKVGKIILYGDASGDHATTGVTDYLMIGNILAKAGYESVELRVPSTNPEEKDRVNAVNVKLKNAMGEPTILINEERCPKLIKDLKQVKRTDEGKIDKKTNPALTHISDALGYLIYVLFPIRDRSNHHKKARKPLQVRVWDPSGTFWISAA